MDARIGGRVKAVQQIGALQHHRSGGSCGSCLLLPAEFQQIDASKRGGRGCGSATRLERAEDAGRSGGCGDGDASGVALFGLFGGIAEAVAEDVGDGEGQRGLRLLRLLVSWWGQTSGSRDRGGVVHINVIVLLLVLFCGRGSCLVVEAVPENRVALLLLDGQRRGGRGAGARRMSSRRAAGAEPLLQCSSVQSSRIERSRSGRVMKDAGRGGQLLLMELLQLLQLVQMLQLLLLVKGCRRGSCARL